MAELEMSTSACCATSAQTACCEPAEKENCCTAGQASCGCAAGDRDGVRETYRVDEHAGAVVNRVRKRR